MRSAPRSMTTQGLPAQPFFRTPEQRAALARQRYFDEHASPSGLVAEAVVHSWNRCRSLGHVPTKLPALDPVSKSTLSAALARNQTLLQAAQLELHALESSLAGTRCRMMLTDASGVIVHVMPGENEPEQDVLNLASRVGVNLAEGHLGTTAPGIVVHSGMPSAVLGCEHFYDMFQAMRCAAAPIRDVRGHLVGVLDVSTEARDFGFDALSVVGVFATSIENSLLRVQSDHLLVLHFQTAQALLNTPMEGLAGVSSGGQVEWVNGAGRRLLGCGDLRASGTVEELLGTQMHRLTALCGASQPQLFQLPCGLGIWVSVELRAGNGRNFHHAWSMPMPPSEGNRPAQGRPSAEDMQACIDVPAESNDASVSATSEPPSLAEASHLLIGQTLEANEGNVARTARLLGVSRGLVYRHLKKFPLPEIKSTS